MKGKLSVLETQLMTQRTLDWYEYFLEKIDFYRDLGYGTEWDRYFYLESQFSDESRPEITQALLALRNTTMRLVREEAASKALHDWARHINPRDIAIKAAEWQVDARRKKIHLVTN